MADNYLEKQYELYEQRKAAWEKQKKSSKSYLTAKQSKPTVNNKKGRRVFISGGARGIGKVLVETFCHNGDQVAFCDILSKEGEQTATATGARFYQIDISRSEDLSSCFISLLALWGDIDIIINNAGIALFQPIVDSTVETFDKIIATNLRPIFITAQLWARHRQLNQMFTQFGRIINICSTRYLMSEPGCEGYAASKGGVYSLTHALALSLAPIISRLTPFLPDGSRPTITNRYAKQITHNTLRIVSASLKTLQEWLCFYQMRRTISSTERTL